MAAVLCLITAALLLSVWLCGAYSSTCPTQIDVKVGDKVELPSCSTSKEISYSYWKYNGKKIVENQNVKDSRFKGRIAPNKTTCNLILSSVTLQDSGTFGFFSSSAHKQLETIFFNLSVYGAITSIHPWEINSTWLPVAGKCEIWLECTTVRSESGTRANYTWAIGNETHTGATFKYVTTEGENTGNCTASNPVSAESELIQVKCRNGTMEAGDQSTTMKIWISTGLGLGVLVMVLVLVLVFCGLRQRKAAPEAMDTLYESIENIDRKATTSKDELSLRSLYDVIQNVDARPPQQERTVNTIYYTVQQSRLMDPPS